MQKETLKVVLGARRGQGTLGSSQRSCLCSLCVSPGGLASGLSVQMELGDPKGQFAQVCQLLCPPPSLQAGTRCSTPNSENVPEPRWVIL